MAKQITEISCFLSSPSDVQEERETVSKIIADYNNTHAEYNKVSIKLLSWENSTFPSLGKSPQDVINKQIGDDYDIFIGIMAHKIGTPTKDFQSGTLEEFERAFNRYKNSKNVDIMFYFRTSVPNITKVNLEELIKIKEFKQTLNGLYGDYENIADFENKFRSHFNKKINDFLNSQTKSLITNKPEKQNANSLSTDTKLGLFELQDGFLTHNTRFISNLENLTTFMHGLEKIMNIRTHEIIVLQNSAQKNNRVLQKKLLDKVANDLESFATDYETEFPSFVENNTKSFDLFVKTVDKSLEIKDDPEGLKNVLETSIYLKNVIISTNLSLRNLREMIGTLPELTNNIIKAKEQLENIFSNITNELDNSIIKLDSFINKYENK